MALVFITARLSLLVMLLTICLRTFVEHPRTARQELGGYPQPVVGLRPRAQPYRHVKHRKTPTEGWIW